MVILPAIDIKDGNCVRLYQGEYASVHKVAEDPMQTALSFCQAGSSWIHMVDLDGAKDAKPANAPVFLSVAAQSGCKVEVGGGIRSMETVSYYLSHGIARVILGSAAIKNPAFVREAVTRYGDRIAVGIDARNGKVAAEGWIDTTDVPYLELAARMEQIGVKTIIFTDISKDGTLSGPNFEQLDAINRAVSCDIIASGGVSKLEDLEKLDELGLFGAICGKSIYAGALSLPEAINRFEKRI